MNKTQLVDVLEKGGLYVIQFGETSVAEVSEYIGRKVVIDKHDVYNKKRKLRYE